MIGGRAMARNLEEIIQSEDPKIVSAAKRKAEKILQSIDDTPGTVATKKRSNSRLVRKSKRGQ